MNQNTEKKKTNKIDSLGIKGKFRIVNSNVYGNFAILLNITKKTAEQHYIIASYFSDLFNIDTEIPWISFCQRIDKLILEGNHAQSISSSISDNFIDKLYSTETNYTELLIQDCIDKKMAKAKALLESLLNNGKTSGQVVIEFSLENINQELLSYQKEIETAQAEPSENETVEKELENIKDQEIKIDGNLFSVPAHPSISPFGNAVSAYKLKSGDKILMTLEQKNEYGKHWVEYFNALDENNKLLPVVATVSQIAKGTKNTVDIVVMYTATEYTKFNIEARVKIQQYDPMGTNPVILPPSSLYTPGSTKDDIKVGSIFQEEGFLTLVITGTICAVIAAIAFFWI